MSNKAITWAWEQATRTPGSTLVLQVLADLADENHSCFPSHQHIAEKARMSTRSVMRRLEELEADGIIRRERRYYGYGRRSTDRYVLNVDGQITAARELERSQTPSDKAQETPLGDNLSPNDAEEEKPQVTSLGDNLSGNDNEPVDNPEESAPLGDNCVTYINTPQEKRDKSLFIEPRQSASPKRSEKEISAIDAKLARLHPTLSVAAIAKKLKVADIDEVDPFRAAQYVLRRATQEIKFPPALVAWMIDKNPEGFRTQLPGFMPGSDTSGEPTAKEIRAKQRALKDACDRGEHDWGPAFWPEFDRRACVVCDVNRRQVDPKFAADEDAEWDRVQNMIGGRSWDA